MSTSEPALAVAVAALAMTPGTSAGPEVADQHAVHALQPRSSHTPRQVTLDSSPERTPRTIALRDSLSGSPTPSSTSNQFSSDAASTPSTSPDCVTPVATTSATPKPSSPSYTHLRAPSDEGGAPISPLFPSPSSPFRPPPCLDAEVPLAIPSPRLRQKDRLSISGGFASGASTPIPSRPPSRPTSAIQMRRGRSGSTASRKSNALASPQPSEDATAWPPAKVGLGDYFSSSAGAASTSKVRYSTEVVVRDFAFERSDPRFKGLADPNQNSKSSQASARSHLSADDELGNENFANSGSSAFSWGFVTSHETDFPAEDDSQLYSEEELDDEDDVPPDFVRGIYQALFDFEPELDTEMVMKTGDVVSVVARKCAGWVQAGRIVAGEITGEIGLVPENYLVLLERDDDDGWGESDEEEEEGEEGEQDGVAAAPVLAEAPQPTDTVS